MAPRITILAVLAAVSVVALSADQRASRERQIVVSATLPSGAPATDLLATDFLVREDRLSREVIRVSPAPPPSHVMLLVDDSQAAQASVPFLRSGLAAFIKTVGAAAAAPQFAGSAPAPQFALMTFGDRPTKRAEFSPTTKLVEQAVSTIFSVPGSGAYLLQAITDACKDLKKRGAASPVILAFVAEAGPEFSNDTHLQVSAALRSAGASLWVIALQGAAQPDRSPEEHERAVVIGDVTTESGGMTRTVMSTQSLDPAFDGMASLLTSRYLVVYGRPEQTIPPEVVEVTSKRPDVRMTSSRWAR